MHCVYCFVSVWSMTSSCRICFSILSHMFCMDDLIKLPKWHYLTLMHVVKNKQKFHRINKSNKKRNSNPRICPLLKLKNQVNRVSHISTCNHSFYTSYTELNFLVIVFCNLLSSAISYVRFFNNQWCHNIIPDQVNSLDGLTSL